MRIILILSICLLTSTIFGQDETYIVLEVRGQVLCKTDSLRIKAQEQIRGKHTFYSATPDDFARLWDIEKETYAYIIPNINQTDDDGWFSNGILTSEEYSDYTANRGETNEVSYLIFNNQGLWKSKRVKVFFEPKDSSSYYFLQFKYNGEMIRNRLSVKEKTIVIDHQACSPGTEETDIGALSYAHIGYFDGTSKKTTMLKGIVYTPVSLEQIFEEIKLLRSLLTQKEENSEQLNETLEIYLKDHYGTEVNLNDLQPQ